MNLPAGFPETRSDGTPYIKVCGLARVEDAALALQQGAAFLGFIFAAESPRRVTIAQTKEMLRELRTQFGAESIRAVGVFVNEPIEMIEEAVRELELAAVQLHTPRSDAELARIRVPVLQAIRVRGPEDRSAIDAAQARGAVLLDTFVEGKHGGTGRTFDHDVAVPHLAAGPVFIAGGLTPQNISEIAAKLAERRAAPYAFDVSSGMEAAPGAKDPEKIRAFFAELRRAMGPDWNG